MGFQQIIVRPLGIITQPNKLGKMPIGALVRADQCYARNLGSLETAATWGAKSAAFNANAQVYTYSVGSSKWVILVYFDNNLGRWVSSFVDTTAVSQPFGANSIRDVGTNVQLCDTTGRLTLTTSHGRVLFNASSSVFIFDFLNPTSSTEATARQAGLVAPYIAGTRTTSPSAGGALANNTHCHCTSIVRRVFADGYEVVSYPSFADHVSNATFGSASNIQYFLFLSSSLLQAGDVIEIYRTKSQAFTGTTGTNTGSDFYLDTTHTLTSAEIAFGSITVNSSNPDASLGEALYTNSGVQTADAAALPPPAAKICATFKGHTFYLNILDRPKYSFRIPVFWGTMAESTAGESLSNRTYGIGNRDVVGNITSGSPTISSISANDLIGIKVGQQTSQGTGTPFPPSTRITAIGASSLTMSANAVATTVGAHISLYDIIELDGGTFQAGDPSAFFANSGLFGFFTMLCLDRILPSVTTPNISPVATVPAAETVLTRPRLTDSKTSFTIRATNGSNFVPQLPELSTDTARTYPAISQLNAIAWSENNQPENCPPLNTAFVGSGEIYAAYPTRDALWIFASDGLWRLSGTGGQAGAVGYDWRVDPVDTTLSLAGPQAGCVLRDNVYAYTNRGLVKIDSAGNVTELSNGRLNDVLPGPPWSTPTYNATNCIYLVADETNDEIWMREPLRSSARLWVYNTITDAFTNIAVTGNHTTVHGTFSRSLQSVVLADMTSTVLSVSSGTNWETSLVKFQPWFSDNPFLLRHWQQVDMSFEAPDGYGATIIAYANGTLDFNGLSMGSRTLIAPVNNKYDAEHIRGSWSIPRNAPAISNNFSLFFSSSPQNGQPSATKFMGAAVSFENLTPQRSLR